MSAVPAAAAAALREALGPEAVKDGDSERDLHGVDLSFHPAAPARSRRLSRVDRRGRARARDRRRRPRPGRRLRRRHEPRGPRDPGPRRDQPRPHPPRPDPRDLAPATSPPTVEAGVTGSRSNAPPASTASSSPSTPAPTRRSAAWRRRTRAGTTTVRYGKMRANVLALEAVLAGGRVIRTGSRAAKTSAGYDLTGLLVGSEGTLAVITEVTLRLHAIPEHVVALRISFPDVESRVPDGGRRRRGRRRRHALRAPRRVDGRGRQRLLGDGVPRGAVPLRRGVGQRGARGATSSSCRRSPEDEGAIEIVHERDPTRARGSGGASRRRASPRGAVPGDEGARDRRVRAADRAAGAVGFARARSSGSVSTRGIVGHAGDGNLHVAIQVGPDPRRSSAPRSSSTTSSPTRSRGRHVDRRARHRARQDRRARRRSTAT